MTRATLRQHDPPAAPPHRFACSKRHNKKQRRKPPSCSRPQRIPFFRARKSFFVFNASGDKLLMQQRAAAKYHSGGLWTNTCCGHPRPGEALAQAVHRRLQEEMRFDCALREAFQFTYHAQLGNGLIEHEFDHVFIGSFEGQPRPNPDEVGACRWMATAKLALDLEAHPERYSYWLRHCFETLRSYLTGNPMHGFVFDSTEPSGLRRVGAGARGPGEVGGCSLGEREDPGFHPGYGS